MNFNSTGKMFLRRASIDERWSAITHAHFTPGWHASVIRLTRENANYFYRATRVRNCAIIRAYRNNTRFEIVRIGDRSFFFTAFNSRFLEHRTPRDSLLFRVVHVHARPDRSGEFLCCRSSARPLLGGTTASGNPGYPRFWSNWRETRGERINISPRTEQIGLLCLPT